MLIKSALLTVASGSLGGMTASRNRGGNYLRGRGIPTNPNTPRQALLRSRFASLASLWGSTLTPEERLAWNAYSATLKIANALGDPVTPTGQNAYVRANVIALEAGLARYDTAPVGEGESEPVYFEGTGVTIADSASAIPNVINIDALATLINLTAVATDATNWYITNGAIPSGVEFTKNLPRIFAGTVIGTGPFPETLPAGQTVLVGETYELRVIRIDPDGRPSHDFTARIVATLIP